MAKIKTEIVERGGLFDLDATGLSLVLKKGFDTREKAEKAVAEFDKALGFFRVGESTLTKFSLKVPFSGAHEIWFDLNQTEKQNADRAKLISDELKRSELEI